MLENIPPAFRAGREESKVVGSVCRETFGIYGMEEAIAYLGATEGQVKHTMDRQAANVLAVENECLREENAALRRAERRDLAQIEGALDRDDTLAAAMRRLREENERLRAELAEREKPCECGQGLRWFDAREQRWEILMADRSENFDEVDMYQPVGAPCPYCGHRLEVPSDADAE